MVEYGCRASENGFQAGQTAKARQGPLCAVTPCGQARPASRLCENTYARGLSKSAEVCTVKLRIHRIYSCLRRQCVCQEAPGYASFPTGDIEWQLIAKRPLWKPAVSLRMRFSRARSRMRVTNSVARWSSWDSPALRAAS